MLPSDLLRTAKLRDTQSRRLVLHSLLAANRPSSPQMLHTAIKKDGHTINLVTIYRALDLFLRSGIVHRHPYDGAYTLCTLQDKPGHHVFLHCSSCGRIEETADRALCKVEDAIAAKSRFRPHTHMSELIGTCQSCQ